MSAKFEEHPLKTMKEVDYTNLIPDSAKKLPKRLSLKSRHSIKINSGPIKNPHAYFLYVHNMYAKFEKYPLKNMREVDYTNSIPSNARTLPKVTKFKRP